MHLGCKPDPALPSELSLGALLQATESGGRQRSDEELVIAVQNGESCALDELLGRHQKMLFSFARRYTANADEARGLVQETMLLATRLIGRFRRESRFVSWLNSIVINTALSEIRREKRILWIALMNTMKRRHDSALESSRITMNSNTSSSTTKEGSPL